MISPHDGSPVLNHVLVLPIKTHKDKHSTIPFVVAEMMTVDNTGFNIGSFLRHFTTKFKLSYPNQSRIANSIVTDKCFANLNGLVESQNDMKLKTYLSIMFDKFTGKADEKLFAKLTLIFLCASHQSKNWKDDIFKFFNNNLLKKDDKLFLCALMGALMNIATRNEFDHYVEALFTIFCSKSKDEAFFESFEEIKKIAGNIHEAKQEQEMLDTERKDKLPDFDESTSNVIYKSSKFFIYYESFLSEKTEAIDENEKVENKFFNPTYANDFLKKNLAYLPLWSRIFTGIGMPQYKRPTNAYIESYNNIIKTTLEKDYTLKLGSIRMNRYINIVRQRQLGDFNLIKENIRDHHVARKKITKKGEETHSTLPALMEGWKGKPREKSSIFFDAQKVVSGAGKFANL